MSKLSLRVICAVLWLALPCGLAYAGNAPQTIELGSNWKLADAKDVAAGAQVISLPTYQPVNWRVIHQMPATVLEVLEEDGVYPNLYFGTRLLTAVPQNLYLQDWWYRTTFTAPAGHEKYWLEFPGINYRAEIWLNGNLVANNRQVVGMYAAHRFDVTRWIRPGAANGLAIKVTPERAIQDVNGVELADSWFDWINWKYLGYQGPRKPGSHGISFVSDRNAGVWKPVYLRMSGPVSVSYPTVNTELNLPKTTTARLTVYAELHNASTLPIRGVLEATITRAGKPSVHVEKTVALTPGEDLEASFTPDEFPRLVLSNPALWWPYTMGRPNLYDLRVQFLVQHQLSDQAHIRFGVRTITQLRDQDESFPKLGRGGNFYLQVNGKNFLIRGADYTPDLLYRYDPEREAAILRYVKDMGLNMLRWESKISSEHIIELADEQGIPVMLGWMCCNQWEKWDQWSSEDYRVAGESLRSQILMLRAHPSAFIWANGSDGLPPQRVRDMYHAILTDLHWQNAVVDTVSSFAKDANGNPIWDGIHMAGPYSWRPPTYWFSGRYAAARGACAEQGDNEHIPPYESLKKFIPADKLWPINDVWYFHAGSNKGNNTLANIQRAVDRRYGPSNSAEEFARKAQLAHYENTRAQFEDFAANGWATHKMTMYWMLDNQWPSFFGSLFDYYLKPGGAYYGAKKGLRPLSIVFDSFAVGDHSQGNFTAVNQTMSEQKHLRARIRIYDLNGKVREDHTIADLDLPAMKASRVLELPRPREITPVYFVRCELFDSTGKTLEENIYWQSTTIDDLGDPKNDSAFDLQQASWANMTALNHMSPVTLNVSATQRTTDAGREVAIRLQNPTDHIAFFERPEITATRGGDEILPILYDDNYVTVFPHESVEVHGTVWGTKDASLWVKLAGYNTAEETAPIR